MTLRSYIFALIAIPLAGLMIVGGLKGFSDVVRYGKSQEAEIKVSQALTATNLTHYLQVERGQSAGFLSSNGTKFGDRLGKTRKLVDQAIAKLPDPKNHLKAAFQNLSQLRASVDAKSLTPPQMGKQYTGMIAEVMDSAEKVLLSQQNPEISRIASGMIALGAAKEAAGQQRAAGAAGFGAGQFEPPVYQSFTEKGATEYNFLHVAQLALETDLPGLDLEKMLKESDVKQLRDAVMAAGPGPSPAGVTAPDWFDAATKWITYLHEVENEAAAFMTASVTTEARNAMIGLALNAAVFLLAAAGCLAIGIKLLRTFDTQFGALQDDLDRLSRNDFDFRPTFMDAQTEIGRLSRSMEIARAALEKADADRSATEKDRTAVITSLDRRLARLAERDLDCKIEETFPPEYEQLRNSFNVTVSTLSATLKQVIEATGSIRSGAYEISHASDDLSHRTESQAATLEETAAALEELTTSVKSAADAARNVEATMVEARQEAENSGTVVKNAVSAMTEIETSSNHIAQIIGVIDDIAFQTNLLALNAGVEAARAGEAGRGFAVVASEVRGLAQRSADAATEIKTLISESSKQVERGVNLVGKAGEALQSIVDRVNHISTLVTDIAEGAVEQSTGLGEINTGVIQLDQVTQQNAAMVEQTTAAGHTLNSDATKLAEMVAQFKISGGASIAPLQAPQTVKPTAHGDDSWDLDDHAADGFSASMNGNAALNKWQDF